MKINICRKGYATEDNNLNTCMIYLRSTALSLIRKVHYKFELILAV